MIDVKGAIAARIAPFLLFILLLALNQPLSQWFAALGWDARWLYPMRACVVAALLLKLWHHYSELSWPVAISGRTWLVALVAGVGVFAVWILPYPEWAIMGAGVKGFDPTGENGSIDPLLALFRLTGAALVVPLMEEIFWRSCLMRWIDRVDFLRFDPSLVSRRAFIVTAALFAVEHQLWLAGLLAGLVYGWLYMRHRNLWVPVIAHTTTNAMLGIWVLQTRSWQYW